MKKFDWVSLWIIVLVFGLLGLGLLGVVVEFLKLVALVKYVFS